MAFQIIPEYDSISVGPGGTLGCCFTCGSPRRNVAFRPTGEILVDLGTIVDEITDLDGDTHGFHRTVICETCILELASLAGCKLPNQVDADNVTHWKTRAGMAEQEVKSLRSKVREAVRT